MRVALNKCKNNRKKLKIILVPDFCPLELEIARFYIGFCLNLLGERAFWWEKWSIRMEHFSGKIKALCTSRSCELRGKTGKQFAVESCLISCFMNGVMVLVDLLLFC